MLKSIVVTVDRFEGDFAVLLHRDHEMLWPKEDLPGDVVEGSVVTLTAMNEKEAKKDRTETAKMLLNDILNETLRAPGAEPRTMDEHETLGVERLQQINRTLKELTEIERKKNE